MSCYVISPVRSHWSANSKSAFSDEYGVSERRVGTTHYTHSGLKNTGAQSTNAIVATRVYDAYGMVRSTTGTWSGPFGYRSEAEIPPNPEDRDEGNESRLVGRNRDAGGYGYQEDKTGLRLLGHRYYDASTGRFLTRDPIKDGRNWYSYCDGDPINGVDPMGLYRILLEPQEVNLKGGIHWNVIIEEDNGDWVMFGGGWFWDWSGMRAQNRAGQASGTGGYKGRKGTRTIVDKKGKSGKGLIKKAKGFTKSWNKEGIRYDEGCTSNTYAVLLLEYLGFIVPEPTPPPGVPTTFGGSRGWSGRRARLGGNKPDGSPTFVYPPMYKK